MDTLIYYDDASRIDSWWGYDDFNRLDYIYNYDDAGRTDFFRSFDDSNRLDNLFAYSDTNKLTYAYYYDDASRVDLFQTFNTVGIVATSSYFDDFSRLDDLYYYNASGIVTSHYTFRDDNSMSSGTTFDIAGRVDAIQYYWLNGNISNTYVYDDANRLDYYVAYDSTGKQSLLQVYTDQNQIDYQVSALASGGGTVTDFDQTASNPWTTIVTTNDAQGRADIVVVNYDNGTKITTDYDQTAANPWTTIVTTTDAQGRITQQVMNNDNGTMDVVTNDVANAYGWASTTATSDAQGRTDIVVQLNDNGTKITTDYDQASTNPWTTIVTTTDAQGRTDVVVQTNDNGTKVTTDFDQANANPWATIVTTETGTGLKDLVVQFNDNGTKVTTDYDQTATNPWTTIVTEATATGAIAAETTNFDNGTRQVRVNDITGIGPFQYFVNHYRASDGAIDQQILVGRDSTSTTTKWDLANAEVWSLKQTVVTTTGQLVYEAQINRDHTTSVHFGGAAIGQFAFREEGGTLVTYALQGPMPATTDAIPIEADSDVRWYGRGLAFVTGVAAAIIVAIDGHLNAVGGTPLYHNLSSDVRVKYGTQDAPVVQVKIGDVWVSRPDVSITTRGDAPISINAFQLHDAIGQDKYDAILTPPQVQLTGSLDEPWTQSWVGPAGVPFGSKLASIDHDGNEVWRDSGGHEYTVGVDGKVALGNHTGPAADGVTVVPNSSDGTIIGAWKEPANEELIEIRSKIGENVAGDTLARHGFHVERLPESGPEGMARPDLRLTDPRFGLDGALAEVKSPSTSSAESVTMTANQAAQTQAPIVVVNLNDSSLTPAQLIAHIRGLDPQSGQPRWHDALSTLLIVKGDSVIVVRR